MMIFLKFYFVFMLVTGAALCCESTDPEVNRGLVSTAQNAYGAADAALLEHQLNTQGAFDQASFERQTRALTEAKNRTFENFRQARLCLFRAQIRNEVASIGQNENAQWLRGLADVGDCLGNQPASTLMGTYGEFFRGLFNNFWNRTSLNDNDCQVLQRAYEVWSSMYDDFNAAETESDIPLYNVNAHNASFYHWADEQRRGRIPPEGLTILHADTHTDMGHVHRHLNHWSQAVLTLRTAQQATMMQDSQIRDFMIQQVRAATSVPDTDRNNILARLRATPPSQLRQELAQTIRESVHSVAQPLAAAQAIGVSNGRYVMCMPPWNTELPRTQLSLQGGRAVADPIQMDFCNASIPGLAGAHGIGNDNDPTIGYAVSEAIYRGRFDGANLARFEPGECVRTGSATFNVTDCNNEELYEVGTGSDGSRELGVRQRQNRTLPPFENFLTPEDRERGFLLDIDLDVFVSEGRGQRNPTNPVPRSYLRAHGPSVSPHGSHDSSNETALNGQVTVREFDAIRNRVQEFMARLRQAKDAGYSPRVITIADSTILRRALLNQESGDLQGGNYTPACLSFLLNYMVRTELNQLYGTPRP